MSRAFIGLGSNLGDRLAYLRRAVAALEATGCVEVVARSSVYETEAVDLEQGVPRFLNAVVEVETTLSPHELLSECKRVERELGRTGGHLQSREIDLDILLYDDLVVDAPDLNIPHPELTRRAFVVVPLLEVCPAAQLPSGDLLRDYPDALEPAHAVKRTGRL